MIEWVVSYEAAMARASNEKKLVFLDFYSPT
jgi:hypothetical protein